MLNTHLDLLGTSNNTRESFGCIYPMVMHPTQMVKPLPSLSSLWALGVMSTSSLGLLALLPHAAVGEARDYLEAGLGLMCCEAGLPSTVLLEPKAACAVEVGRSPAAATIPSRSTSLPPFRTWLLPAPPCLESRRPFGCAWDWPCQLWGNCARRPSTAACSSSLLSCRSCGAEPDTTSRYCDHWHGDWATSGTAKPRAWSNQLGLSKPHINGGGGRLKTCPQTGKCVRGLCMSPSNWDAIIKIPHWGL